MSISGSRAGQRTMENSIPVAISSDQTAVPISGNITATLTGTSTAKRNGTVTASSFSKINKTTYTEQTVGAQRQLISSSASDSSAGTGARTVKIYYFNATLTGGIFTETVTMNGTTAVNTVATDICFIEKIEVITIGTFGAAVGTITLRPLALATIGTIAVGDVQTFWCHHYIGVGTTCVLRKMFVSGTVAARFYYLIAYPLNSLLTNIIEDEIRTAANDSFERDYEDSVSVAGGTKIVGIVVPSASGTYSATLQYKE
jgi:hypothetical protein